MNDERGREVGAEALEEAAAAQSGFFGELWSFLKHEKKWWLIPIVATLVLLGALIALGSTAAAPFIYTFF